MNARQRRKQRRKWLQQRGDGSPPRHITNWAELAQVPESKTHQLEIDVQGCNGWIKSKENPKAMGYYLSTHTFYGSCYRRSTKALQQRGFNVTLANWDA